MGDRSNVKGILSLLVICGLLFTSIVSFDHDVEGYKPPPIDEDANENY